MGNEAKTIALTEENFQQQVLASQTPVLVDVWASWCAPCRVIAPVVEELASDFQGRAKVGKLDVDDNATLASRYGVRSIPTLLFFKNGEVVDQLVGAVPRATIAEKLNALVGEGALQQS